MVFWYKSEGDRVEKNEVLVEVQTEKATFEVEAPATGLLRKILVHRGETADVGDVLAWIEEDVTQLVTESGNQADSATALTSDTGVSTLSTIPHTSTGFVQAPPRIRRLASEYGVNLADVKGTGPNGRITEEDVRRAATRTQESQDGSASNGMAVSITPEPAGKVIPLTPMRRTIARRMTESLQQSAQLTLTTWADVTYLAEVRKRLAPSVSWNTWVMYATVLALKQHPELNASWEEGQIRCHSHVNLGIAVDTEAGLVVPVISQADTLSLQALHEKATFVVEKARSGRLTSADLTGGTFTVTNLGMFGVEFFTPILNPPEAAILGVGRMDEKLVLKGESVTQVYRIPLSLTFDHRVIDGAPAARFLQTLISLLNEPQQWL